MGGSAAGPALGIPPSDAPDGSASSSLIRPPHSGLLVLPGPVRLEWPRRAEQRIESRAEPLTQIDPHRVLPVLRCLGHQSASNFVNVPGPVANRRADEARCNNADDRNGGGGGTGFLIGHAEILLRSRPIFRLVRNSGNSPGAQTVVTGIPVNLQLRGMATAAI